MTHPLPAELLEPPWLLLATGALLLLAGRRLYLLLLALIGFGFGVWLVSELDLEEPIWLLLAVLLGVLGGALALVVQRLAVALAGLMLGGAGTAALLEAYGPTPPVPSWLLIAAGALAGALLLSALFDMALVVLSSLIGAGLLVAVSGAEGVPALLLLVLLLTIGVSVQSRSLPRAQSAGDGSKATSTSGA